MCQPLAPIIGHVPVQGDSLEIPARTVSIQNQYTFFSFFLLNIIILLDIHQDLPDFVLNRTLGLGVRGGW